MSPILPDIERRAPLELCNISLLTNSSIICNIGCLLGMSLKPTYHHPALEEACSVYTCRQRPFNTTTPVLNCTVFLESQDLVSKATRADIIHANTLHAWRRITMTKILRGRMELRIEFHESET